MKKVAAVIIVIMLVWAGWWWYRSHMSNNGKPDAEGKIRPGVTSVNVSVTDIDNDRIKLISHTTINNPLPVPVHATGIKYKLFIDQELVVEDKYNKPVDLAAAGNSAVDIPMEILMVPLKKNLDRFERTKADSALYTVTGTVDVDVPIAGERTFTFERSQMGPSIFIPKIKVLDVGLNAFRLKKKGMDITMMINNPNSFPLKINNLAYNFTIPGDLEIEGVTEKVIDVPARGSQEVSMHADVEKAKILKTGWDLLLDKKDTPFNVLVTGILVSEKSILDNSKLRIKIDGTLDEIFKAKRKLSKN